MNLRSALLFLLLLSSGSSLLAASSHQALARAPQNDPMPLDVKWLPMRLTTWDTPRVSVNISSPELVNRVFLVYNVTNWLNFSQLKEPPNNYRIMNSFFNNGNWTAWIGPFPNATAILPSFRIEAKNGTNLVNLTYPNQADWDNVIVFPSPQIGCGFPSGVPALCGLGITIQAINPISVLSQMQISMEMSLYLPSRQDYTYRYVRVNDADTGREQFELPIVQNDLFGIERFLYKANQSETVTVSGNTDRYPFDSYNLHLSFDIPFPNLTDVSRYLQNPQFLVRPEQKIAVPFYSSWEMPVYSASLTYSGNDTIILLSYTFARINTPFRLPMLVLAAQFLLLGIASVVDVDNLERRIEIFAGVIGSAVAEFIGFNVNPFGVGITDIQTLIALLLLWTSVFFAVSVIATETSDKEKRELWLGIIPFFLAALSLEAFLFAYTNLPFSLIGVLIIGALISGSLLGPILSTARYARLPHDQPKL